MPEFEVMVTEHIQQTVRYKVNITKKQVVDALKLVGDDAKNWTGHVQDYCEGEWGTIRERGDRLDVDQEETQVDIDEVTELGD